MNRTVSEEGIVADWIDLQAMSSELIPPFAVLDWFWFLHDPTEPDGALSQAFIQPDLQTPVP
jgi:hypothetical protein